MPTPEKIFNDKVKWLLEREERLKKRVSSLEVSLLQRITDKLLDRLEKDDSGQILNNGRNIKLINAIDEIFDEFTKKDHIKVVRGFASDLVETQRRNELYFKSLKVEKPDRFKTIAKRSKNKVLRSVGITEKGNLIGGSYLDGLITDTLVKQEVKKLVFTQVSSGGSFQALKDGLSRVVVGDTTVQGKLQQTYRNFAYDTFQRVDRTSAKLYADELKMDSFVYAGGLIKTSRDFCEDHNGKIVTREEASKFKSKIGSKSGPIANRSGYDPLVDLGGFGCRHSTRWIPNTLAVRRRKDLKLNEEGRIEKK